MHREIALEESSRWNFGVYHDDDGAITHRYYDCFQRFAVYFSTADNKLISWNAIHGQTNAGFFTAMYPPMPRPIMEGLHGDAMHWSWMMNAESLAAEGITNVARKPTHDRRLAVHLT